MMTTWIGIAISVAWLLVAESAVASPAVGPREAVEAAVVRVLSLVQDGQAAGAPVADRSREIRRIAVRCSTLTRSRGARSHSIGRRCRRRSRRSL